MNIKFAVGTFALATLLGFAPAVATAETIVSGGGGGIYPPGTSFNNVPINAVEFGFGLEIADTGSALGRFCTVLLGVPVGGVQQRIVIEGVVASGSHSAANVVTYSGTSTVDMGAGAPPTPGVPFTATVTTDANDQGTLALVIAQSTPAPAPVPLGAAGGFGVLAASTATNTGTTTVNSNIGVSPGTAVTGFPPGVVIGGTIHSNDATAIQAQSDLTTAWNAITATSCTLDLTGQDLGGKTLTTGVYCFSSSAGLTGTLTLDAGGNPSAPFIFKMGSTLTTASASRVLVINGGSNCNVFWQVGSSATLGTTTSLAGNIIALASITLTTGATVSGRALARTAAVTMDTNNVTPCPAAAADVTLSATVNSGTMSIHLP